VKLLIVHLSDIHLVEDENSVEAKFAPIARALQNEETDLSGVVIVVSGDIAFAGKKAEYEKATRALAGLANDLRERTKVDDVRFVFVPGNHDCDFDQADEIRDIVIRDIRTGKQDAVGDSLINCCTGVQQGFFDFRNRLPAPDLSVNSDQLYWEFAWEKSGTTLVFRCYNTAWMSQKNEQQGTLQFPAKYLQEENTSVPSDYVMSVFHHPYNWMPSASYRQFRGHIEATSDLILTGHEHEPEHYQKYSFTGEVNEYLEGAVLQESGRADRSGFHAIYLDLVAQRQRTISFWWKDDLYVPEPHSDAWVGYKRGSRGGKRDFDLSEDFDRWLNNPGAAFVHPAKPDLTLGDIFIPPNLKEFQVGGTSELVYGELVESSDVLQTLAAERRTLLFGRHQAGKTALAKMLFRRLYNSNLTPVLVSGNDITSAHLDVARFEDLVESQFQKQYRNPTLPKFQQLDRDKTIVLLDDFDHARLNAKGRLRLLTNIHERYERLIVFGDDILKLEEITSGKTGSKVLHDYEQFEIVQFGHLLRSKLIDRWYSIGIEYVSNPEELARQIHEAEQLITALLGKNYLPSYPVFVLTLIQAQNSATQPESTAGTYGSLYEVLITQALAVKSKVGNLDMRKTCLSELAFWMFSHNIKRITDDQWGDFHATYIAKYKIRPSRAELKREFEATGFIEYIDQRYGFAHSASYFYFVARYLRDNITKTEVRELIADLCSKLNKQEHASILLFLTHLSKDPFIVEIILKHARAIFLSFPAATFSGDVEFLKGLADDVDKIVLHDKDFAEVKEERLRRLDSAPTLADEPSEGEEETNEALKMIADLNMALRTLEIVGQLVKNFPGSLVGEDKFALVKECYQLGLRTVSMLLGLFQENSEAFIDLVVDRVIERDNKSAENREQFKKKVRQLLFWMIERSRFGLIKRISLAVGHTQLGETYREVLNETPTNAVALLDISVKLDNLGFPENELQELSKRFTNNVLSDRLLRQLVVEHFYLFPTSEQTKQKVCSALKIKIHRLRQIDEQSKDEKKIARV
jgi:hypothetical protein